MSLFEFLKILRIQRSPESHKKIPALPSNGSNNINYSLVILANNDSLEMAIYSIRNYYFLAKSQVKTYIFYNGKISNIQKEYLKKQLPIVKIIEKEQYLPYLPPKLRELTPFVGKLAAPYFVSGRIIYFDPDVLFLSLKGLDRCILKNEINFYMKDVGSYYSFSVAKIKKILGLKIPLAINSGLMIYNSQIVKQHILQACKHYFECFEELSQNNDQLNYFANNKYWYADQTIWAIIFTNQQSQVLSRKYWLYAKTGWKKQKMPTDVKAIHFSGPFKNLFWNYYSDMKR